jgi:hypothetical protein
MIKMKNIIIITTTAAATAATRTNLTTNINKTM